MRYVIGWLFILAGAVLGLYVGGWCMFIKPIIDACIAFDRGTLTGLMVGSTVLKCIFASCVGSIIFYVGVVFGNILLNWD